jgi:hypothetical protein
MCWFSCSPSELSAEPITLDVRMPFQMGWGERTGQSESTACHLIILPAPSHMPLTWHSGTEVVTSALENNNVLRWQLKTFRNAIPKGVGERTDQSESSRHPPHPLSGCLRYHWHGILGLKLSPLAWNREIFHIIWSYPFCCLGILYSITEMYCTLLEIFS